MSSLSVPSSAPLYLVRHAEAEHMAPGETDFDRVLTGKGTGDVARAARIAGERGWHLGTIIASPARRCAQTATALAQADPTTALAFRQDLYSGALSFYRALVDMAPGDVPLTIVGHNPMIDQLACELLGEETARKSLPGGFPPGAILRLARGGTADTSMRILDFLRP